LSDIGGDEWRRKHGGRSIHSGRTNELGVRGLLVVEEEVKKNNFIHPQA